MSDIREFQITWKQDLFFKKRSTILIAKCLIKKSRFIVQRRSSRQVNSLMIAQKLNQSLAEYLQQRLEILQNEIDDYNQEIKKLTEREKDYWKQFEGIIEKRTKSQLPSKSKSTSSDARSVVIRMQRNNENIPPLKYIFSYKSMHKSYQPILPTSSRMLQKKWDDKYYSEHRLLVRDARPSVDTRPPKTYMHLHMKLKKLQLEEERTAAIERDNRILLEKMSHIMRTTSGLDHRNEYETKSLNQEKRRKELLRVSKENAVLAKRIIERKPDNRENWKHNWSKNSSYLDNISKYNSDWHLSKSTSPQTQNGKPALKRSQSVTKDDKKGIKARRMTNETPTTNVQNNETQK